MLLLLDYGWFFAAMLALACASAFFSCSEAALFSLQPDVRRAMIEGNPGQRTALELLRRPERLLSSILFWNLLVNTLYFTLTSIVAIRLEADGRRGEAGAVATISVFVLLLAGEVGPKAAGVTAPRGISGLVSIPLAGAIKVLDPVMPVLSMVDRALRRLIWPRLAPEPYLEIGDLERAISLSTTDSQLARMEESALQSIVQLSDLPADELMRPRRQYDAFTPPVTLQQLRDQRPLGGYALVTEPDSDEIAAALPVKYLAAAPREGLEHFARPVVHVPWCATAAVVLEQLRRQQREVAAVVNELGETIGIITLEDVLETLFEDKSSRSARLLATASIAPAGDDRWLVTGMTNLRRLSKHFGVRLEPAQSATVGGVMQEILQKIPEPGDEADWSGFHLRVLEASETAPMKVELTLLTPEGPLA